MAENNKKYYGKRPLWQWVVIYLIIGGIVYGLLYYSGVIKLGKGIYPSTKNSSSYNYSQ